MIIRRTITQSCCARRFRVQGTKRGLTTSRRHNAPLNTSEFEVSSARQYCLNLLRKFDSPSFTLQTFIPPSARDAYLAIRAFNVDVAQIADATASPAIGAMRMQFWRETIHKSLNGIPPKEPVAILLAKANEDLQARTDGKSRLSKSWLLRVINTRQGHLGNPPYPTLADLESYAENTYSTLLYLTLGALPLTSITADHLASHIGKAAGIATVLRGVPLIAFPPANQPINQPTLGGAVTMDGPSQGAVLLPLDVMADSGIKEEEVLRQGPNATGLRDAVFVVATRANDHLITAREMLKNLRAEGNTGHEYEHKDDEMHHYSPAQLNPGSQTQLQDAERAFGVLMQAVPTSLWLGKLQEKDFDIFAEQLRVTDWRLPWKAYWAFSRRKF